MRTIYDWTTLALFCALVTLFLHRSVATAVPGDRMIAYLPAGLGCAAANWFGNAGHDGIAILLIGATVGYAMLVLRPWEGWR